MVAFVAACAVAGGAFGAAQYSITDLGAGTPFAEAYAINNAGQVAGIAAFPAEDAFEYYSATGLVDLGSFGGLSRANGINGNGQIVGWSQLAAGGQHVFLYAPGSGMIDMAPFMGGLSGAGTAINNSAQLTGYIFPGNGSEHAFLYTPNVGFNDLGTLSGSATDLSQGDAINAAGQVAGWSYAGVSSNGTKLSHAFLYSNGMMTDLGTLGGTGAFNQS
jgi:probable HAF family extracellular repeat protein